jgi:hypothetical protein
MPRLDERLLAIADGSQVRLVNGVGNDPPELLRAA